MLLLARPAAAGRRYNWELAVVDGAAAIALVGGIAMENDPGAALAAAGTFTYLFGAPVAHASHGNGGRDRPHAPPGDDAADRQLRHRLRERPPREERVRRLRVSGGQERVGGDHPREPVRLLADHPQPEQPAPVLAIEPSTSYSPP